MKSDRRSFLHCLAAGACTPLLGTATASCSAGAAPVAAPTIDLPEAEAPEPEAMEGESSKMATGLVPRRKFGRHEQLVSAIGFGGHTLKLSKSKEHAREIVARGIDQGVTFFDNAWDYHDGTAEEVMGHALRGQNRDELFLMSKFCIFHSDTYSSDKSGAMKMLEDTLRRLGTDHLDLWMLHNVKDDDAKRAYERDTALSALELAKQQGKIRFTGFTGHTDPRIHIDLIEGGFEWDATLMPVSALGALSARQFEKDVMPLCEEKNIAVLGMKGFGGSKRAFMHGQTNVEEVVRYSLSYPQVCTHMIGIDKLEYVDEAVAAAGKTPMTVAERDALAIWMKARGAERYAMYLDAEYDRCYSTGGVHPCQLG